MRKMKKLVGYVFLLAIPVVIAAALLQQMLPTKMQVLKLLRFLSRQYQKHVQACVAVIRLVSQHQTTTLFTPLMVNLGLF